MMAFSCCDRGDNEVRQLVAALAFVRDVGAATAASSLVLAGNRMSEAVERGGA